MFMENPCQSMNDQPLGFVTQWSQVDLEDMPLDLEHGT
jgi:hypothetical protein